MAIPAIAAGAVLVLLSGALFTFGFTLTLKEVKEVGNSPAGIAIASVVIFIIYKQLKK